MCDVCRQTPCSRHCPNSKEQPLFFCDRCGYGIYEGADYYDIRIEDQGVAVLCEDCMKAMRRIAQEDD